MAVDIWRFSNDGKSLGPLHYDSATHEEDLDGTDKLTVITRQDPQKRERLVWKDASGRWHEHMVDNTRRTHSTAKPRTEAVCSNSVAELFGAYTSGTVLRASVQSIVSTLLANTRWTAGTCGDFGVVELEVWHKNVRECLSELCEMVSGELDAYVTVDTDGVSSRVLSVVAERGSSMATREFSYGVNASGIKREIGAEEVYTAIIGYGAKVDATDRTDYSQRISVTVESDLDKSIWGIPNGDGTFSHNFTTYTDNACTDKAFLAKQCRIMLNSVSVPVIRYEFDALQVDETLWSDVTLGTVVLCTDEGFNPPLRLRERVSHIRREFSGRTSARIAIGNRTNPMVERFKSEERTTRRMTGNGSRLSRPGYTRGNYGDDYQAVPDSGTPAAITVVTPPNKTSYHDYEEIDFTGLVVQLLDNLGEVYTDVWHPDGTVPITELSFPITRASYEYIGEGQEGSFDYATTVPMGTPDTPKTRWTEHVTPDNWIFCDWSVSKTSSTQKSWHYYSLVDETDIVTVVASVRQSGVIDYTLRTRKADTDPPVAGSGFYFLNGLYGNEREDSTAWTIGLPSNEDEYYTSGTWFSGRGKVLFTDPEGNTREIDWVQNVPVQWLTSDGEVFESSFPITVYGNSWSGSGGGDFTNGSGGGSF